MELTHREKIGISVKKHWDKIRGTEEYQNRCNKMSINSKGKRLHNKNGFIKGMVPWNKGKHGIMPIPWNKGIPMSKVSKEKMLISLQKSWHTKPNKLEKRFIGLLTDNNLQYKFTGDFSFIIAGKNPDFVNCNGKKKVIEIAGEYWHTKQEMEDRTSLFREYGYDTLIIWDSEFDNKKESYIIDKVKKFDILL